MRRAMRWLLWPGALVLLVLAIVAVNVALVVASSSDAHLPPIERTEAPE